MFWGHQIYFNHLIDTEVREAQEETNRSVIRYVQMLGQVRADKEELRQGIIHLQAMYDASKFSNNMLEEQIDVVNHYWKKEYIKVSDELFDIKNTDK
jgi:hypothetical protein